MAVTAFMNRGIARLQESAIVRQSALVFVATMVMNVGGFVFHAIASRALGVANYGVLYTLMSAAMIASLPAALLAPVVARFAAEFKVLHDDRHLRGLTYDILRFFGSMGVVYVAAAVAAMGWIGGFLHLPAWTVPLTALFAAGLLLLGVMRAVAQGTQEYGPFAASFIADGFCKVGGVLLFTLLLGMGLMGGILSVLAAVLGALAAILVGLVRRYRGVGRLAIRYDWRRIVILSTGSAAITLAGALIGSVDVVLVKHYFDADQAGMYSAASLGGKVLMYFVAFVPMVLLPQATQRHVRGERTRGTLAMSVGILVLIAAFGSIGIKYFGIVLLHALVGHAFDAAAPLLLPYSVGMMCLALSGVLGSYGIATHRVAFALPLVVGVAGTLGAIVAMHATLAQVVWVVAGGNAITALAVACALGLQALRERPRTADAA